MLASYRGASQELFRSKIGNARSCNCSAYQSNITKLQTATLILP